MGYLRGYEYDIFISYAHLDNQAMSGQAPWVAEFVANLNIALKQRLGNAEHLRIFLDQRALRGDEQLTDLIAKAKKSALFVPIVSPSYVSRKWPLDELAAFREAAGASRRVFAVDMLPLDSQDAYPEALRSLIRTPFWYREAEGDAPMTHSSSVKPDRYNFKVSDFAVKLREKLIELKAEDESGTQPPPPSSPLPAIVTVPSSPPPSVAPGVAVLLAQVTDDLEDERDKVRTYLEQFGITVLPASFYPQGGADFAAAFAADCAKAKFFLQMLGPAGSRQPPDLQRSYSQFQYQAAKAHGLQLFLWRRPDLDLAKVTHRDAALLSAPEVRTLGLEEFKADVLRAIQKPVAVRPPPSDGFVFINSDRADLELAKTLGEEIARQRLPIFLAQLDGPAEEVRRDLEENMIECSALVLVYGKAQPTWVRAQLRWFTKLNKSKREAPPKVLAIYAGPPEDKPDDGILWPEVTWIDARKPPAETGLNKLVSTLIQ